MSVIGDLLFPSCAGDRHIMATRVTTKHRTKRLSLRRDLPANAHGAQSTFLGLLGQSDQWVGACSAHTINEKCTRNFSGNI